MDLCTLAIDTYVILFIIIQLQKCNPFDELVSFHLQKFRHQINYHLLYV